jgi:hypothetical protein
MLFQVSVDFLWVYPNNPHDIQKVIRLYANSPEEALEDVKEQIQNTFLIGICKIENYKANIERLYTSDEWEEIYNPIRNESESIFFDYTDEDDLRVLKSYPENQIWTRLDNEDDFVIVSGLHWINRESYLISSIPVKEGDENKNFLDIFDME